MPISQPVTETVILRTKAGVNLDNESASPTLQAFIKLTNILNVQPGFVSQFWGHGVEDPNTFIWYIDWKSLEHSTAFTDSIGYKSFRAGFSQVFDLEVGPPLTMYTYWNSDEAVAATAALKAPVTEVSFFMLSNGVNEEAKKIINDALEPVGEAVQKVGKAWASAMGWVFERKPHSKGGEWLHGIFGYASIEDHMKWRETPEHNMAVEIFAELESKNLILQPANVPGIDLNTGYFHVKFHIGE